MEELHYQQLRHALKIIKTASSAADISALTSMVLNALCEALFIDRGLFILPGAHARFTDFRARNVEEKYQRQFKEYYHQYDPFKLIPGNVCRKRVVRAEELVSYPSFLSSEYYTDFLRPQEIFYKTVVFLKSRARLLGMIALFRPKGTQSFSEEDVTLLRAVSPYIAHSLEDLDIRKSISIRENIFRAVEPHLSGGLIVLDGSWNLLYTNQKAEELCRSLTGTPLRKERISSAVPHLLIEDCCALKQESRMASADFPVLPKYRVLKDLHSKPFSVHSQMLPRTTGLEGRALFVISIEELANERSRLRPGGLEQLKSAYRLSERELEIVFKVCEGLRNVEIAEKLFISEITVKKHIQNIFDKTGVQSRSALIHKVLASEYT